MDQVNEKNKRKKHRKNDKTKKSIKGAKQFEKKKDCSKEREKQSKKQTNKQTQKERKNTLKRKKNKDRNKQRKKAILKVQKGHYTLLMDPFAPPPTAPSLYLGCFELEIDGRVPRIGTLLPSSYSRRRYLQQGALFAAKEREVNRDKEGDRERPPPHAGRLSILQLGGWQVQKMSL